jgi:hypothetical protein
MRAYIEADVPEESHQIIISTDTIILGKVELDRNIPWLYTVTNDDGDLVINNSEAMEAKKWDHITDEITGSRKKHTWVI